MEPSVSRLEQLPPEILTSIASRAPPRWSASLARASRRIQPYAQLGIQEHVQRDACPTLEQCYTSLGTAIERDDGTLIGLICRYRFDSGESISVNEPLSTSVSGTLPALKYAVTLRRLNALDALIACRAAPIQRCSPMH